MTPEKIEEINSAVKILDDLIPTQNMDMLQMLRFHHLLANINLEAIKCFNFENL